MNKKHQFIKQFLESKLREEFLEDQLGKVLKLFDPDNYHVSMQVRQTSDLVGDLMNEVCGVELMDWVYWWLYECEHGTKHYDFSINGREYTVSDLTLTQFLEIVDAGN